MKKNTKPLKYYVADLPNYRLIIISSFNTLKVAQFSDFRQISRTRNAGKYSAICNSVAKFAKLRDICKHFAKNHDDEPEKTVLLRHRRLRRPSSPLHQPADFIKFFLPDLEY